MKLSRFYIAMLVAVLAFSTMAAAPAYARSAGAKSTGDWAKKSKIASLTVDNRTGGVLYVHLSGAANYSFAATKQGKTTFSNITPGQYSIVVTTSACHGSLSYNKNIKGKSSLKPVTCHR
jgi:hypothetical protein